MAPLKKRIKDLLSAESDHRRVRFLGSIIYKYFDLLKEKPLGVQLKKLSLWIAIEAQKFRYKPKIIHEETGSIEKA